VAIAGQRKKLTVELTVKIEAGLRHFRSLFKFLPSLTVTAFSGKACFMRLSGHQQVSRSLTVKLTVKPSEAGGNLDADRRCTTQSEAQVQDL
jgi:hypothetical protein